MSKVWHAGMLLAAFWSSCVNAQTDRAALASQGALAIGGVVADATRVDVGRRLTLEVDLTGRWTNPFDAEQIRLDAEVAGPAGVWSAPGFLCQPYTRERVDGAEQLAPAGPPRWQVRLAFDRPGEHTITVKAADATGEVVAEPLTVTVVPGDGPGWVRLHPDDARYFATSRGETLFPIGANVCWAGRAGTFAFDEWLPEYAAHGADYFRIWLAPPWTTVALNTLASGYDGIDLANAWRLDHILELAEDQGLRALLCIDSFNILRSKEQQHGSMEDTPYVPAHGGPVAKPADYFTHPAMLDAYRDRLRYLVARWGYSPSVFAWEFWNEVDIIGSYDPDLVTAWHRDMARHLRSIDPWGHLITTSTARAPGDPQLDALPELQFVQTHHYGAQDMAAALLADREHKAAAAGRPHYHGEFGISHSGKATAEADPRGVHLHNALYASVGQQQAATPMTWWWDSYIHPLDLYPIFAAFAGWIDGFEFAGSRPLEAGVAYADPEADVPLEEVAFRLVDGSWSPAPFNQPVSVSVARDGAMEQSRPLSRVLHGVHNHPKLHNPATFELDVPEPTRFLVQVEGVSGHGGARLQIRIDGETVVDRDFADTDEGTETLTQYNGVYPADLSPGRHTVTVENIGRDWMYVRYRVPALVRPAAPALRVSGLLGDRAALVWAQSRYHVWSSVGAADSPQPVPATVVTLHGVPAGRWQVHRWDTIAGERIGSEPASVGADGVLMLRLDPIVWDAAFQLTREE